MKNFTTMAISLSAGATTVLAIQHFSDTLTRNWLDVIFGICVSIVVAMFMERMDDE